MNRYKAFSKLTHRLLEGLLEGGRREPLMPGLPPGEFDRRDRANGRRHEEYDLLRSRILRGYGPTWMDTGIWGSSEDTTPEKPLTVGEVDALVTEWETAIAAIPDLRSGPNG